MAGRPARLSLERIVAVAMTMHPDHVTMQAVAAALDVAPSALYRWVHDREHLLDLVSAALESRIGLATEPTAEDWREWLVASAHRLHDGLVDVPGFAARLLTGPHRHEGPTAVEQAAVRAYGFGGVPEPLARQYWQVFATAICGWVAAAQNERYRPRAAPDFEVLLDVLLRGTTGNPCRTTEPTGRTP